MKIELVNPKYKKEVKLDKNGDVLCPVCGKELAWVAWGEVDACTKCKKPVLIHKSQG